jgi:class 3 adenylate cyclase/tetratricopeptide (TPR) repeat protein
MRICANCGRESPDEFAFCPACAAPLDAPARPREVRKTVTVVFCDVTGSTALGERLDPESLRDVQSRYFDTMRAAIERHGGTVEKYIGDAVMAVFGIPQVHEDDALRAARAVDDMREGLAALNKELERDRGVALQVRIGVNTGEVVAGDPATGQALVTGDTVNVAARLEQHAAPGEALLGEGTHRLIREAVDAEPVQPLEVKGKGELLRAWRLLRVGDATTVMRRHMDSPMVGRERQLAQLRQAYEAAVEDAACQLFTVLGPAGVGKSRLVEEFLSGLDGAKVLRGRCLPYGEGITYFPIVEAIKQAAGLGDFDLPDVVETKVCAVLEGDQHQERVCGHVSQLMGVAETAASEETFWAIRRFFEASARDDPLVLVLDDIHWGEPTFLDLVEHIADWSRGSPILLVCMARPDLLDARPTWGGGKLNATTVSLEPLSGDQAETLIANLLGSADLPAEVAGRIVETAEGNPLFVEETLAMLIDDGLVAREDGRWVATGDLSGVTVPPSIHALLAARLDRLTSEERTVLEAAAVVGKQFPASAVRDLVPEDARPRVPGDLMSLVRKELIRPDRATLPGEDAFRFRHLLIRDASYEAIPKAQRAELHERFADWLERVAGDAVGEQEEIVGYHLEQACRYRMELGPTDERTIALGERAAVRLSAAGRRSAGRGDHLATANLLGRALSIGSVDPEARARRLYDLGDALTHVGDVRSALSALDEAAGLAEDLGATALQWLARVRRSAVRQLAEPHARSTDEFRAELQEAVEVFEALGDEAGLAAAWAELAHIEWMPCHYDRAEAAGRLALDHARRSGDDRLIPESVLVCVSAKHFGHATPDELLLTLDEMREEISRSRFLEGFALVMQAFAHGMRGDLDEARRAGASGLEIATNLGRRLSVAAIEEELAELELRFGNLLEAEAGFRRSYEILEELGDEGHRSTTAAQLARVLSISGRDGEAERYAEEARTVAAEDDLASQVLGRSAQARVLAARGDLDEAERLAREAVEMFADAEAPNEQGDIWMDLAHVLRRAGKPVEARAAALEALALYERKGNRPSTGSTRAFIEVLDTA